jgi:arylsulfatase A-like enzyme
VTRLTRTAAVGAAAGMAIGAALGLWASRINGDEQLRMAWLALGRVLPGVVRIGLAGMAIGIVLGAIVAGASRLGRKVELSAGVAVLAAGAVGAWLALGPYRPQVFELERASTPRLTAMVIAFVLACGGAAVAAIAAAALRGASPKAPGRFAVLAGRAILAAWAAAALFDVAYVSLGSMRARGRPSVIVVSLDTLRADRLGFMGNTRGLTPHLDALAAEGATFERAIAPAPWTLASHASLFTSKLPFDHHARLDFQKVAPQQRMLAEEFRQAGYRTAAFTADGYVAATFGFGQGFEIYDESDDRSPDALTRTLGLALRWIRAAKDAPFLAFVHTYEVHSPYTHPDRADPAVRGRLGDRFTNVEIEDIRAGRLTLTSDERRWVAGLYDGDVAYADRLVGEFLETLRRDGVLDEAILVVLSDHGDDLWDHSVERSPGHGHSLYQELIHVPLFVRWPKHVASGARIVGHVSLLDVAPTLLALTGLPRDPAHEGRSLESACRAGEEPPAMSVTAESTEYGPDRFAILQGSYKAIFTPWPDEKNMGVGLKVAPLEIFDLSTDPAEQVDLSPKLAELPPEVIHMVSIVRARAAAKKPHPAGDEEAPADAPSEELLQKLKALGYVQ